MAGITDSFNFLVSASYKAYLWVLNILNFDQITLTPIELVQSIYITVHIFHVFTDESTPHGFPMEILSCKKLKLLYLNYQVSLVCSYILLPSIFSCWFL